MQLAKLYIITLHNIRHYTIYGVHLLSYCNKTRCHRFKKTRKSTNIHTPNRPIGTILREQSSPIDHKVKFTFYKVVRYVLWCQEERAAG